MAQNRRTQKTRHGRVLRCREKSLQGVSLRDGFCVLQNSATIQSRFYFSKMKTSNQFQLGRFLVLLGGALVFFAIFAYFYKSAPQSTTNDLPLSARAAFDAQGLNITNNDQSDWMGCEVGVNANCATDMQNPPYQTEQQLVIDGRQTVKIPYSSLTAPDGTLFDPTTHAVNSIVIMCSMGTANQTQRTYCGTR